MSTTTCHCGLVTCTTFGWLRLDEMAVSMTAIFSLFSLPVMYDGNTMIFTATVVPFQVARNT